MSKPTQDERIAYVLEHFSYDPETGRVTRKSTGTVQGSLTRFGYLLVKCGGFSMMAHRIAWIVQTGKAPVDVIDHINGTKTDNRWVNLRDVNQSINCLNTTKHRGIERTNKGKGKWRARLHRKHLGVFDTEQEAIDAYNAARQADMARKLLSHKSH